MINECIKILVDFLVGLIYLIRYKSDMHKSSFHLAYIYTLFIFINILSTILAFILAMLEEDNTRNKLRQYQIDCSRINRRDEQIHQPMVLESNDRMERYIKEMKIEKTEKQLSIINESMYQLTFLCMIDQVCERYNLKVQQERYFFKCTLIFSA